MTDCAIVCVDVHTAQVDRPFHYAVPPEMMPLLCAGMRVRVPFGQGNKPVTGYVTGFSDAPGVAMDKLKSITALCGDFPVFTDETLTLARWMRDKYYTTLAACLRCIEPPGLPDGPGEPKTRRKKIEPASSSASPAAIPVLTGEQQAAVDQINAQRQVGNLTPVLLHGVTGSGKTEVYLRVIAETLKAGRQAIVLVPEIALTPQTVGVFTDRFGDAVTVTHSRLSAGERYRIWKSAYDGRVQVMIGPRSAVFTPFHQLGIIIVDEEHEHTYQSETTPKYDAREVARKRGELTGALVVMGSATPSMESYYHALPPVSDFRLIKLTERVNRMFPEVTVLDMRRELAEGNTSLFGRAFQYAMAETLAAGRQVMLFLNRRGHSTFVSCRWCGHVLQCENCNVNFTYHADGGKLLCHYCGRTAVTPDKCPACGSAFIRYFGVGTQKVEEETHRLFPGVGLLRMDMDTTRGKYGHAKILEAFRQGEAQVLIGTQMIAKGLDFPNVVLVGVVAADISLFTGDFRAGERTFQLLTQVSGRAGRAGYSGRVFLQTYNPEHYSVELSRQGNYEAFYGREISVRRTMNYPPFTHVFVVLFTGPEEKNLIKALHTLLAVMNYCNKKGRFEMLGPAPAFISKIKKQYRWKLLVKCENEEPLKQFVIYCMNKLRDNDPLTGITAHLTLDPVMME